VKAPITSAKYVRLPTRNIVFVCADNLGHGELGSHDGGILRGAPTPRIDSLASVGHTAAQLQCRAVLYTQPLCALDRPAPDPRLFLHGWAHAVFKSIDQFQESLKKYPPIPMGTRDPYKPAAGR
jgi:hypothetical protein